MITTYRALRLVYRFTQIRIVQDLTAAAALISLVGVLLFALSMLCVGLHGVGACSQ